MKTEISLTYQDVQALRWIDHLISNSQPTDRTRAALKAVRKIKKAFKETENALEQSRHPGQ